MKKYIFILFLLCLFIPLHVSAEDTLTCKVLHKLDGTTVYYDSNGNHTTEAGLLADATCNSTCRVSEDVDESWGVRFLQTSEFSDIPYCINSNYGIRGCFTGALNYAYAVYDSGAWISKDKAFLDQIVEYAKNHPETIQVLQDVGENRSIQVIQDISYEGEPSLYQTNHSIVSATSAKVCDQLLRRSYLNNEGEITLIYSSIMSHIATTMNASMIGIRATLSSINSALNSGRVVLVSISAAGGCNAIFTKNTHYITIVKRNEQGQYLVLHSGNTSGVSPSGWYDESVIRQALNCVNAGAWSFMPNDCFEHVYEVNAVCSCDTTTGYYTYNRTNADGTITPITWAGGTPTPEGVDLSQCPGTCNKACNNPRPNEYYCQDGEACSEEEYRDQCMHVCETPEETGDGNYYCNDGAPCSESEYNTDCLGMVNCTPTMNMPSDCEEILDSDLIYEGTYDAMISDINQISTSCNSDINQVKSCVLGKNDLTNETFNSTEYELGEDNPYCDVWCNETYEFQLPTAQYTTSGGFFTLSTSIKGTRDCYVSSSANSDEPINVSQFERDLEAAERAVIDAWNEYNHWREGTNPAYEWTTTETDSDNGCISSHEECSTSCDSMGNCHESCHEVCDERCDAEGSWTVYHHEWNYTAYRYDGSTYTAHQSEITDGGGSCYTCGCEGEDGESQIPLFQQRADAAKQTLITRINELNRVISRFNSCTGSISNSSNSDLVSGNTTSTGWDNDMNFEPRVEFAYNENYNTQINGEFDRVGGSSTQSEITYCTGETDQTYECISGTKTSNINQVVNNNYMVLTCDDGRCGFKPFNVSTATWVSKSKTNSARYESGNRVSTYTQYGTVRINDSGNSSLWTDLPDGSIPVSLSTSTGVYPFKFTFYDIGQSNQTGELGRLMNGDEEDTVVVALSRVSDSLKCTEGVESATINGEYVCHYLNNCPNCSFSCDDDNNCEFDDSIGECPNCIFDGTNTNFTFRSVSLNNVFPNTRVRGSNWDSELSTKAEMTLNEIAQEGEEVYVTPQYSYTLTPLNLQKIREYNDEAGSYTNSTVPISIDGSDEAMRCDTISFNGQNYKVRCQSAFLDIVEDDRYRNVYVQNDSIVRNDEWELFDESDCASQSCGPSWK